MTATTHPRIRHVQGILDRLERLVAIIDTKGEIVEPATGQRSEIDKLRRRLLEAVRRDLTPSPAIDGYARSRGASPTGVRGGGASVIDIDPDTGERISVPVTSVEAAVIALDETELDDDVVHDHVTAAVWAVESALGDLVRAAARLDALDAIAAQTNIQHNPSGYCLVCTRYVPGNPDDRLRSGMCRADYAAWTRSGRPDRADFIRARRRDDATDQPLEQEEQMPDLSTAEGPAS